MPHYIKTCLALACLALICGCTIWPQKPAAWSNATGAEQFERLWWQDVKDKNWSELEQRLSGTYTGQIDGKTLDRAQMLARLKQMAVSELSLGDVRIQPSGDAAVITYFLDVRGSSGGQPLEMKHASMMTVWQHQKRGWMQIAHSESH